MVGQTQPHRAQPEAIQEAADVDVALPVRVPLRQNDHRPALRAHTKHARKNNVVFGEHTLKSTGESEDVAIELVPLRRGDRKKTITIRERLLCVAAEESPRLILGLAAQMFNAPGEGVG